MRNPGGGAGARAAGADRTAWAARSVLRIAGAAVLLGVPALLAVLLGREGAGARPVPRGPAAPAPPPAAAAAAQLPRATELELAALQPGGLSARLPGRGARVPALHPRPSRSVTPPLRRWGTC